MTSITALTSCAAPSRFKRAGQTRLTPYRTSISAAFHTRSAQGSASRAQKHPSRSKAGWHRLRPKALREPLSPKPRRHNMNLLASWRALIINAGGDRRVQLRHENGFCRYDWLTDL